MLAVVAGCSGGRFPGLFGVSAGTPSAARLLSDMDTLQTQSGLPRYGRYLVFCILLVGIALGSTSCIYWRLNTFRAQLSKFTQYCTIEQREGPTIVFKTPVLQPGDLQWLVGIAPSDVVTEGDKQVETYLFRKMYADGDQQGEEEGSYDFPLEVTYRDGLASSLMFPARIRELVKEEQIKEIFNDIDKAKIQATGSTTSWHLGDSLDVPKYEAMLGFIGVPFLETTNDLHRVVHLRYQVGQEVDPEGPVHSQTTLVYGRTSGRLVWADIRLGYLYIHAKVGRGKEDKVTIKRVTK